MNNYIGTPKHAYYITKLWFFRQNCSCYLPFISLYVATKIDLKIIAAESIYFYDIIDKITINSNIWIGKILILLLWSSIKVTQFTLIIAL